MGVLSRAQTCRRSGMERISAGMLSDFSRVASASVSDLNTPTHLPPLCSSLRGSDFDCSSPPSQGHDRYGGGGSSSALSGGGGGGGGGAAEAERRRRDESLFSPQELARIKKQFEKSLEATSEDE